MTSRVLCGCGWPCDDCHCEPIETYEAGAAIGWVLARLAALGIEPRREP